MTVRFDRRALVDLDAIRAHVGFDSPKAAVRLYEDLKSACAGLSDFPMQGRASPRPGLRELATVRPYIVIYSVDADVRIRRIIHGARLR